MLALPWTTVHTPSDPATGYTVLAARLPLRSRRDMPRFLWWALRIRHRLAGTPGLLGHALAVDIPGRTFWIVSAWRGRAELGRFDREGLHHTAKVRLRTAMLPSTLVVWSCRADELPITWDEARRRIAMARAGLSERPTRARSGNDGAAATALRKLARAARRVLRRRDTAE